MKNFDARVVKTAAIGRWDSIISKLAPEIPDGAFSKLGRHVSCPIHSGGTKGDGFKLFKKDFLETGGGMCNTCGTFHDGFKLLMWLKGWDFPTTVEEVAGQLGLTNSKDQTKQRAVNKERESEIAEMRAKRLAEQRKDDERIRLRLRKIWSEAVLLTAPVAEPARLYLASRKIRNWDRPGLENVIRFHPSLPCYDEDLKFEGNFPAIVLLVCTDGKPVTIHRHYLTPKGEKAPVQSDKKMCEVPSDRLVTGGGVFTSDAAEVIDVCEGLETGLSIEMAMGVPVWPLVNATLLAMFNPPKGTKAVRIWADKDVTEAGINAANALKVRLWEMGIKAQVMIPSVQIPVGSKGVDWADVWFQLGRYGFPQGTGASRVA
jgi:putative DNA primase/helicase